MSKLTALLKYGHAGTADKKKMLGSKGFENDVGKELHTLLQSEATAISDSTLVQEEVYKTVVEGAEPFKCMREVNPIVNVDSYSLRIVTGETGTYAEKVAEGQAITLDTQTYSKTDITIDKYGTRPLITTELIEDSLFDVVELELKKAGARLENGLNRVVLAAILAGVTTSTLNPAGSHIAVSDIAQAAAKVKKQNYLPDTLVTHPTAEGYLLQDSNLAYVSYAGQSNSLTAGTVPKLMGLTPYTCTATDAASPTWDDTTAASDVTALVFSKNDLGMLGMRRDLAVEQYEDPIHDLVGISCTMRFGYGVINETSACKIYHK